MTKIKIDSKGILYLERAGALKKVFCPYPADGFCGDYCALFKEVYYEDGVSIQLCSHFHQCKSDEFEDERVK